MDDYKKAVRYYARYISESNAAELIRSYHETGNDHFLDEDLENELARQQVLLADKLDRQAEKSLEKYREIGIEIDAEEE